MFIHIYLQPFIPNLYIVLSYFCYIYIIFYHALLFYINIFNYFIKIIGFNKIHKVLTKIF